MKRFFLTWLPLLALTVTGCGSDNQEAVLPSASPIEVSFSLQPTQPLAGEAITFSAKVTQDGQPVDDAKEVTFEWWKDGQEQHQSIPAVHQRDGLYTAQQTIDQPGSYLVYYHVTARDFHNMQKVPFLVKDSRSSQADTEHVHGDGQESGQHHASGVDFHFMPPASIQANESAPFTVHVMKENQALTQAAVRFEYWQGKEEKHAFVDAAETQAGQYSASVSFPSSGAYTMKVHVEKKEGDIHDHKEFAVTVQ